MSMKKTLLIANAHKPAALEIANKAAAWLEGKADILGIECSVDADLTCYQPDLVVIFGGDGTILRALHRLGSNPSPVLTVNLGSLAYLAEFSPEDLPSALQSILDDDFHVSNRMMLKAEIVRDGTTVWCEHAVNEFVVAPSMPGRTVEIRIEIDDTLLTQYKGDGLIVATPTGSTAYALSAGGPILNPDLQAMVLVPVCPHHLANRPLVLNKKEVLTISHFNSTAEKLTFDGRTPVDFERGDTIRIAASEQIFPLILKRDLGRYDILRAKLGWGGEG